jgi:hypothetical protein
MATAVGRAGDVTVIGDTVNVAARLEKAAGPGEVLCGRLTVELAGGRVRFRERQPVILKGKREPVEAWVADSLRPADTEWSVDGPRLVGREDELGFLVAQWRRAVRELPAPASPAFRASWREWPARRRPSSEPRIRPTA